MVRLFRLIIIAVISFFIPYYLLSQLSHSKKKKKKFYCTIAANALRQKFHIPIIDTNMLVDDSNNVSFSHWATKEKLPHDNKVLHSWKSISPLTGKSLTTDADGFLKRVNDTLYYEFQLITILNDDSSIIRVGNVFQSNIHNRHNIELTETGIDSLATNWGLFYLVRGR